MNAKFDQSLAYESLSKEIYEAIIKTENVHTIKVEHNVNIVGKSGARHQFDVFWEFMVAGITYRTCIECKFLTSKVKKSHVIDFAGKLEDIGNANGVFVTNEGYQDGAIKYAKSKNIKIVLVNYLLQSIGVTANIIIPSTEVKGVNFDIAFASELKKALGKERLDIRYEITNQTILCDAQGNEIQTLLSKLKQIKVQEGRRLVSIGDAYLMSEFGPLKLESLDIETTFTAIPQQWEIKVNEVSKAIIEDILDGSEVILNVDGTIERSKKTE